MQKLPPTLSSALELQQSQLQNQPGPALGQIFDLPCSRAWLLWCWWVPRQLGRDASPGSAKRVCPMGQAVSWGTRSHGHRGMPSEGSPCAMSQETQGARGWNSQRWTRADGEGSCTPLRAGTSVPEALGLRGWLEARSQQPCFSQPSHPLPGPEKAPRLEVPLLWQQGQMAGTTRAQRSSGQAEPRGSAAEAGHCPPPPDVSCLRSRHGLGAARS